MRMFLAASVLCGLSIATLFFVPQPAFSQAFTSSLTGLVTDPSGGAVPNAAVRIKSVATSEERQAATGADGRYTFSQLLPGDYELTAESAGFKAHFQRGITLKASQSAAVDVALQLGEVTQRVEIAETSVQLDTQTANQSVTLSRDMVLALPTNARNPMLLVHATAGVTAPGVGVTQATQDQNHDRFGLNGGRSTTTQILLDGVSATTGTGWNGLLYAPSIDSVQEVQVIRNAYDAQFGRSAGGTISLVTKGGASDFHGTAYEFLRNSAMDATTWANNRAGLKKPIFQRHQFGGNFSGPVSRTKRIFFFGNYEGLRQGTPATSTVSLPTAAERSGDFSDTFNRDGTRSNIFNPFSTRPNPSGAGYVRDAFPNNRIPANLLDPVGVKAAALYPEPNNPGDPFTHARNYVATGKASAGTDRADIRGDWAVNDKYTTYGRYSRAFRLDNNPADIWESYGGTGPIHRNRRYHVTWGNTIIPGPTWVINVLAGHGQWTEQQRSKTFGQDGTVIGLPASLVSQFDVKTIPQLYPSDYSNISHSRDLALTSRVDNIQVNGTHGKGAHNIRMGFTWESNKQTGGSIYSGDFNFSRGMTSGPTAATTSSISGNSIASMLLGTGSGGTVQKPAMLATNRIYYGWYIQDTWRVGKRLTISPGLRYDIQKPATERFNRFNNFYYDVANPFGQQTGMSLKGGLVYLDSNNRYSWDPDYRDFAPRMGVSYKVTGRIVVRAGYGIFYPTVLGSGDSTGYSASSPWVTSSGGDGINPANLFRNPFPAGLVPALGSSQGLATNLGLSAGSYQRNHPSGYSQNYSLDLQLELTKRSLLEVGYAGNSGRKMNFGWGFNDNQLDPEYLKLGTALDERVANPFFGKLTSGSLTTATIPRHRLMRRFPQFDSVSRNGQTPGGSARFDALLVKLSKQFSSGLMLLSSYQWSKGIDNVSETEPSLGGAADGIRNSRDVAIERSLSAHDIPHSFVNSVVYEMPVGRGKKFGSGMPAALDYVAGGWQVAGVIRLQSGLPIRMTAPSLISQYGFGTQLPDLADARQIPIANRVPERWFNTAAFKAPAPFTVGSAPRRVNELRADFARHADLSLMKNFRFRERVRAQFRAEFFNLTNTPQFGWPDTGLGSTTFGVVSGTMNVTPRNVQFGLKIDF
jgi:hypothetical protein